MLSWVGCFFIYSFLGCILETVFCFAFSLRLESRKCLLLSAMCPVYGLGGVAVCALSKPFRGNNLIVFFIGMVAASLVEYVTDMFYKEVLGVSFWDYSQRPLNINGRIWLVYSVLWGILSLFVVNKVHPYVWDLTTKIPTSAMVSVGILFLLDTVLSSVLMYTLRTKNAINVFWLYQRFVS